MVSLSTNAGYDAGENSQVNDGPNHSRSAELFEPMPPGISDSPATKRILRRSLVLTTEEFASMAFVETSPLVL
ncbi:MAG: hypothetical protein ACE5H4_07380 [Candidatus Thorarchaeota archaeon]